MVGHSTPTAITSLALGNIVSSIEQVVGITQDTSKKMTPILEILGTASQLTRSILRFGKGGRAIFQMLLRKGRLMVTI